MDLEDSPLVNDVHRRVSGFPDVEFLVFQEGIDVILNDRAGEMVGASLPAGKRSDGFRERGAAGFPCRWGSLTKVY